MPRKKTVVETIYPEILNMEQFQNFLHVSYGTAMELITTNQIPAKRINREWRISKQAVIDWINRLNSN